MKKFLSKKTVMITFWCVTAVLAVLMIFMAARPVSYGWAYKGTASAEMLNLTEDADMELKFSQKEIDMHIELDSISIDMGMWYLRDGYEYVGYTFSYVPSSISSQFEDYIATESEFDKAVKELKADKQAYKNVFAKADKINAFKCEVGDEELVCTGAIIFTVVCSVLVAATLTFSILSTKAFIKAGKEQPQPEEIVA